MLKALFKKQLAEYNAFYFVNPKTNKKRSTSGIIGFALLFALVFFSCGMAFAGIADFFAHSFIKMGLDWLYFVIMGVISVFASSFVNMFIANNELFGAKDNELLLSLPIKPSKILCIRMVFLYAEGLLFHSVCFLPALIVYWIRKPFSVSSVLFPVLTYVIASFTVLSLSCAFGWIVAMITKRIKNKSIISVLITLVLIGVYYVVYFKMNDLLNSALTHSSDIANTVKKWLPPIYFMGKGAAGDISSLLLHLVLSLLLVGFVYYILSVSFIKIVTGTSSEKKKKLKTDYVKTASVSNALFNRELKHFLNSPAYMINCGLGLIMMLAASVVLIVKRKIITAGITSLITAVPSLSGLLTPAVASAVLMLCSTVFISAPSVSLEGRSLWIIRSLPVSGKEVLKAKEDLHLRLAMIPVLLVSVVASCILKLGTENTVMVTLFSFVGVYFICDVGLFVNIYNNNFEWTNETVPIKQGISGLVAMLSGMGVSLLLTGGGYFLRKIIDPMNLFYAVFILLTAATVIIRRKLYSSGAKAFDKL